MIVKKEHLEAIEALNPIQREAVVLYGAGLFRKGLCRGAIYGVVGAVMGGAIATVVYEVTKHKKTSKAEEEPYTGSFLFPYAGDREV